MLSQKSGDSGESGQSGFEAQKKTRFISHQTSCVLGQPGWLLEIAMDMIRRFKAANGPKEWAGSSHVPLVPPNPVLWTTQQVRLRALTGSRL